MITSAILNIVYVFVLGITSLISSFGDVTAENAITQSIVVLNTYLSSLNAIIPIETIVAIILFDLAFESIYFIYKLIRWGYQKVPFIN